MTDAETIAQAVIEALEKRQDQCTAEHCHERCGITPVHHAEDHVFIRRLRASMESAGDTVRKSVIKWLVKIFITLVILGLAFQIFHLDDFFKK